MFHVITLLSVSPWAEGNFLLSTRNWQSRARRIAPDLISSDLLRHAFSPLFHCHNFWQDEASYLRARQSPAISEFLIEREPMGGACLPLGPFSFARFIEAADDRPHTSRVLTTRCVTKPVLFTLSQLGARCHLPNSCCVGLAPYVNNQESGWNHAQSSDTIPHTPSHRPAVSACTAHRAQTSRDALKIFHFPRDALQTVWHHPFTNLFDRGRAGCANRDYSCSDIVNSGSRPCRSCLRCNHR